MAETVLAVPCCRLMFMTYIFRHCGFQILKIISIQAHRDVERECVCVLHKLIILSKFVTEKEKKKNKLNKTKLHLHYSKIIGFVVLLSFCVILTRVRMTQ